MKTLLLACCLLFQDGDPAPGTGYRLTDPEFIVVYDVHHDAMKEPLINMRVVIHAKTEGEAVMKATLFVQNKFGVNSTDSLEFVEVAPRGKK